MKLRRRKKVLQETVELNITAFLNLMVVLVPFLLITAVFSRMTVLELTLPGLGALTAEAASAEKPNLQLQMLVYPDRLEIQDAQFGRIASFVSENRQIDWRPVNASLLQIKAAFPESRSITLLLHPEISYSQLIEIMDQVSVAQVVNQATLEEYELFPDVAVGGVPTSVAEKNISLEELGGKIRSPDGGSREE